MAKLALVYGMRLFPAEEVAEVQEATRAGATSRGSAYTPQSSRCVYCCQVFSEYSKSIRNGTAGFRGTEKSPPFARRKDGAPGSTYRPISALRDTSLKRLDEFAGGVKVQDSSQTLFGRIQRDVGNGRKMADALIE